MRNSSALTQVGDLQNAGDQTPSGVLVYDTEGAFVYNDRDLANSKSKQIRRTLIQTLFDPARTLCVGPSIDVGKAQALKET